MDNNNKKQQQNFQRSSNTKPCLPVESNRKSSDSQVNKQRNSRRREQVSTPRNEQQQRNSKQQTQQQQQQQSAKLRPNVDKRPRPRGGGGSNAANASGWSNGSGNVEDNVACTGDDYAVGGTGLAKGNGGSRSAQCYNDYELNSVYSPGSKKQNLNHLLNFHYTPREADYGIGNLSVFGHHQRGTGVNHGGGIRKQRYNKEQFLQANFQFVIRASAKPLMTASPDTLIDWSLIEQINIQTTEEPQCPICLYPPVAAKLTRCGHVYCWPCLLHYLSLSDKSWRKCPICYEAIHASDLKSCTIMQQSTINVNDTITFQLMRRRKGSMYIERFNAVAECPTERFPLLCKDDDAKRFSKFLISRRADIIDIMERERRELLTDEDATCPEYIFIQQALAMLNERRDKLRIAEPDPQEEDELSTKSDDLEINNKTDEEDKFDELEQQYITAEKSAPVADIEQQHENEEGFETSQTEIMPNASTYINGNGNQHKYYYFYQSNDGQNIYLHPLNVKMLQACYGTLDHAPLIIEARILQKEQHSMDEEHRRKFTCLGHLPLTCQFAVVEVDLQPPIVTGGILKLFKDDLQRRRQERQRREREERKREKQINEINDRQMGKLIASAANLNLSSVQEFPTCGFDNSFAALNDDDMPPLPSTASAAAMSTTPTRAAKQRTTSYSSIAVTAESPKQEYWPTIGSGTSPILRSNTQEFVSGAWGRAQPAPLPINVVAAGSSLATLSELRPTTTRLGDVLAEALTHKQQKNHVAGTQTTTTSGVKQKKKAKKMMPIFATGMNYNGNN